LLEKKVVVKIKGLTQNSTKFHELKTQFYKGPRLFHIEKLFYVKKSGLRLVHENTAKFVNMRGYDKRKFSYDKKNNLHYLLKIWLSMIQNKTHLFFLQILVVPALIMNNVKLISKIKVLKQKLSVVDTKEQIKREGLFKIIELYNSVTATNLLDKVIEEVENLEEPIKLEVINARVQSILGDFIIIKYKDKSTESGAVFYYYDSYVDIYIKNKGDFDALLVLKKFPNLASYKVQIYKNKKVAVLDGSIDEKLFKIKDFLININVKFDKIRIIL
jgi:hypothetical protein